MKSEKELAVSEQGASPATRSAAAIPSNIRRTLEESNLPIEVATAIADRLEASQSVGGEAVPLGTISSCPSCEGAGRISNESPVCWRCGGSGRVMAYRETGGQFNARMRKVANFVDACQPVGGEAGAIMAALREQGDRLLRSISNPGIVTLEHQAAALIEKLEIERDEDRAVLMRHGFVRCDIPACNCGSWHPRFGLTERMQEIKDLLAEAGHELSNENGHLVKVALSELIAERDALKSRLDAPCEEVHKKLDSLKLLSIEAAYAELADYARDLYRKWQEAHKRAQSLSFEIDTLDAAIDAARREKT